MKSSPLQDFGLGSLQEIPLREQLSSKHLLRWTGIAFLINSFEVYAHYYAISPSGSNALLWYVSGTLFLAGAVAALLVPLSLIGLVFKRTRTTSLLVCASSLIYISALILCIRIGWHVRIHAFHELAERSGTLVAAIKQFEEKNGFPPKDLKELTPAFLPEIPSTGMGAYPRYEYEAFDPSKTERIMLWYDLGSRGGKDFVGLWKYHAGDGEHAILVLILEGNGVVVDVDTARLPAEFRNDTFDPILWRNEPEKRMGMVRDLLSKVKMRTKTRQEIETFLGVPTGNRVLRKSPWELRVSCPSGGINWDMFFYWPTLAYPSYIYGGDVERVGDWAYVHE